MAYWDKLTRRGSVSDRRGVPGGLIVGGGSISIVGLAIVLLINYLGGGDIGDVITELDPSLSGLTEDADTGAFAGADDYEVFASTVLGSTDEEWTRLFAEDGVAYEPPTLVLFRGATASSCGGATSDVGPHYCPLDETIYLDETFFDELQRRFGAGSADVSQAYVIAHEVGHHVQQELGLLSTYSDTNNETSIAQELQADCLAGVWAHSLEGAGVLEAGEIKEALEAAAAVGDDRIQAAATGRVNPETWTHGSAAERTTAFTTGFESGDPDSCGV